MNKTTEKINFNNIFPKINNVNVHNLLIDYDFISSVTLLRDTKKIANIISSHISKYKLPKESIIVDATGGVGGDSIMFCLTFNHVVSIEIDPCRYKYLKNNLEQYKFDNTTILNDDSSIIISKLHNIDIIYIDPPWGGKTYKIKSNIRLTFGNTSIEEFITNCFDDKINISVPKIIVLKMPKNYDLINFYNILTKNFDMFIYEVRKFNIIVIEKK